MAEPPSTAPQSIAPRSIAPRSVATSDGTTGFGGTVDRRDADLFAAQASGGGDPRGSSRPLHQITPVRLDFIRRELLGHFRRDDRSLSPFSGLRLADIGCGGGLIAEPLTRLGC